MACYNCTAGHWCQDGRSLACGGLNVFCPAGSATPTTVAIGHYSVPLDAPAEQKVGQAACEIGFTCVRGAREACPNGRVCDLVSTARVSNASGVLIDVMVTSQERCDDGEFVFNGTCITCPEIGSQCRDGLLWLEDNYWYNPKHGELPEFWGKRATKTLGEDASIYRCAKGACVVNKTTDTHGKITRLPSCEEGRKGTMCAVCDDDYFVTNMLECKPCPKGQNALKTIGLLLVLVIVLRVAWQVKGRIEKKHPLVYKAIRAKAPEVTKLLTGMFQILGGFATILYRVPWPSAFTAMSSVMGIVNLDVFALPSIRCTSHGKTFFARFDLHMTSMLVVTGLFFAVLMYSYSKTNKASRLPIPRSLVWNILLPFLFIIYPSISKTAILMLRCRTIDGASYLLSDIALSCETGTYAAHKRYAIFGVLVFPIGIVVFFTALVGYQREKLPPDWWPQEEKVKCKERYEEYRKQHGRSMSKKFPDWKEEVWDLEMAHHLKFYNRFGFLFAAYTKRFWWFESLITIYKLTMTVLILFVSDEDEPKILMGMLGATLMLGIFSFYQPFKNPDLLSINTGAQMVVLLVLFTAQYLIFSDGGNWFVTSLLVGLALTPLVAGVYMTLRVSEISYVPDASAALEKEIGNLLTNARLRSRTGADGGGKGGAVTMGNLMLSVSSKLMSSFRSSSATDSERTSRSSQRSMASSNASQPGSDVSDSRSPGSSVGADENNPMAQFTMSMRPSELTRTTRLPSGARRGGAEAGGRINAQRNIADRSLADSFGARGAKKNLGASRDRRADQDGNVPAMTNPLHAGREMEFHDDAIFLGTAQHAGAPPNPIKTKKHSVLGRLALGWKNKVERVDSGTAWVDVDDTAATGAGRPANKRLGGATGSKEESFVVPGKQMSHKSFDLGDSLVESRMELPALGEEGL
jgi:hypothetical protein